MLYGLAQRETIQNITKTSQQAIEHSKDPAAMHALMKAQGIEYIYLGARGGAFSAQALLESPLFESIYVQDGVWIFRLKPDE